MMRTEARRAAKSPAGYALAALMSFLVLTPLSSGEGPSMGYERAAFEVVIVPSVTRPGELFQGYQCPGVAVGNLVVSAAHCFRDPPRSMDAVFGVNDLCGAAEGAQRFRLGMPTIAPLQVGTTRNDLAFFHLEGTSSSRAPWPPQPADQAGSPLVVAGWGSSQLNGPRGCRPTISRADPLSDNDCMDRLKAVGRGFDRSTERCAELHPDQCQGSSGAGLISGSKAALGVLSWAPGCSQGYPAVFVDLEKSFSMLCESGVLTDVSGVC